MSEQKSFGFETRAIHAGAAPDPATGARQTPIYQTTSFVFDDVDDAASLFNLQKVGFIYSRLTNPTVSVLEERLANLEGGAGATATSSGHAAQLLALFPLMEPGDEIVASRKLYGGTLNQLGTSFPRAFGWKSVFVDTDQPENVRAAITAKTKAIFVESLANPGGVVTDLEAIAKIADEAGIPLIVDNTLATPYLINPIQWGATLVVHSTTKFLSGNGTSVGGVVIDSGTFDWGKSGKFPALSEPDAGYHGLKFQETFGHLAFTIHGHAVGLRDLGPSQAPLNAFLTLNGIETLPLRMQRHSDSALKVAQFLESHPAVGWVSYAGLESSKYNALAKKYLPKGAGAVLTFGVKGGFDTGVKVVENVQLLSHLANIGDSRSLIIHPSSTTHRQLSPEGQAQAGAGTDVLRLSIGLESVEDIIADLDRALSAA
ncbi:O-acetylhomoserine aminocarboxypropyltransferase [Azospirillum argentinense]|uniref:O-acetylhomoserine aminocarboxypropyltransferase n=1 Tax=Azospirillum argentinense TaxID=2970906 RepID=A0A5B0KME8_9PROT|nr:O-acetylhomoserine aminocarboxypropyltransferase [Azospirillum argentinense]KAA1053409.1 O-acetylhomoserine sulfhydrylase, O-succinylhomoserine sulfhydrylase [Azospirillum argentinense]